MWDLEKEILWNIREKLIENIDIKVSRNYWEEQYTTTIDEEITRKPLTEEEIINAGKILEMDNFIRELKNIFENWNFNEIQTFKNEYHKKWVITIVYNPK